MHVYANHQSSCNLKQMLEGGKLHKKMLSGTSLTFDRGKPKTSLFTIWTQIPDGGRCPSFVTRKISDHLRGEDSPSSKPWIPYRKELSS